MFLYNYGGCAVYVKEKTYTVNISDYVYSKQGTNLILSSYVGNATNITVPSIYSV